MLQEDEVYVIRLNEHLDFYINIEKKSKDSTDSKKPIVLTTSSKNHIELIKLIKQVIRSTEYEDFKPDEEVTIEENGISTTMTNIQGVEKFEDLYKSLMTTNPEFFI